MMPNPSILIKLLVVQCLAALCVAKDFDFFYFVQQWPGSYCDTRQSCCYPKTGKPAEDFGIHGLWPNYNDGTYPSSCDSRNSFDDSEISDLASRLEKDWPTLACPSGDGLKFWGHEWNKHGTCAESVFDQHSYFQTALDLKNKANLLQALTTAGIRPNGKFYHLESIKEAIRETVGVTPYIECNVDTSGNHQLYQVYMCVDSSGSNFIKCPVLPHSHPCGSKIEFPPFSDNSNSKNDEL
uniref:S-RNase 36 n=1 Tax=Camellia oleifera TaxID=385388 RepID=A0AA50LST0_9ERIC|nr:S-RNase 36 [Camellia oleifera]